MTMIVCDMCGKRLYESDDFYTFDLPRFLKRETSNHGTYIETELMTTDICSHCANNLAGVFDILDDEGNIIPRYTKEVRP